MADVPLSAGWPQDYAKSRIKKVKGRKLQGLDGDDAVDALLADDGPADAADLALEYDSTGECHATAGLAPA